MESPIDLQNSALRLHRSVLDNLDKDVKYQLRHPSGEWMTMPPKTAVIEMGTGRYSEWRGPFDEVQVDKRISNISEVFIRVKTPATRQRTSDEIWQQVKAVGREHGIKI